MGWQDRDYSLRSLRDRAEALGIRRPPVATLGLLLAHGVAFVLMLMVASGSLANLGDLARLSNPAQHPLGIVLHPLATTRFLDLLFVELVLWSLGGQLEPMLGGGLMLGIYLAANLVTGGAYVAMLAAPPALAGFVPAYPIGALAAWCAIAARRARWETVDVLGRRMSTPQVYGICAAIVAALTLLTHGRGAVAWLCAACAGGAAGYLLDLAQPWLMARLAVPRERVPRRVPPRVRRPVRPAPLVDEIEVDAILAKISRSGLASLSDEEKAQLESARQAKLRREHDRGA